MNCHMKIPKLFNCKFWLFFLLLGLGVWCQFVDIITTVNFCNVHEELNPIVKYIWENFDVNVIVLIKVLFGLFMFVVGVMLYLYVKNQVFIWIWAWIFFFCSIWPITLNCIFLLLD